MPILNKQCLHTTLTWLIVALVLTNAGSQVVVSAYEIEATPTGFSTERAISFFPYETGFGTFVTIELDAGESGEFKVTLGNAGTIRQSIRTYAVPATTAVNGGFEALPYDSEPDEPTSWLDFPERSVEFGPSEGEVITVKVSIPPDTQPGEYVTGLAAEHADPYGVDGTDIIQQRVRWVIPVLIVVPGSGAVSAELGDAHLEDRNDLLVAQIGLSNTGDFIVRPQGEARLYSADGSLVGVTRVELKSFYPGTSSSFLAVWENVPSSESYTLNVSLQVDGLDDSLEYVYEDLVPVIQDEGTVGGQQESLRFSFIELSPLTKDTPPSMLQLTAEIANNAEPIENARVSMVTYQDGVEIDRYPILQGVTINQGTTPVQARYALPGGFTNGTYTFAVTIEIGSADTQTILATQKLEYEITVP